MKFNIILILLCFTTLLVGQKNEFRFYTGLYNYDWLDNPRNRFIEGNASIYGIDYTRRFFTKNKYYLSSGAGLRNFRSNNFQSGFLLQDGTIEVRNVITNSYYLNILFKAEAKINQRLSADLIFNNLILLDKDKDFIHQNRFHNNLDLGLSYMLTQKISLGITSQLNLVPIGNIEGTVTNVFDNSKKDYNIRPGGLGISLQLMYKF